MSNETKNLLQVVGMIAKDAAIETKEAVRELSKVTAISGAVASVYTTKHVANGANLLANACERGSVKMAGWILSHQRM